MTEDFLFLIRKVLDSFTFLILMVPVDCPKKILPRHFSARKLDQNSILGGGIHTLFNGPRPCALIVGLFFAQDLPKLHRCTELLSMNEELKQARKAFEIDEEKLLQNEG